MRIRKGSSTETSSHQTFWSPRRSEGKAVPKVIDFGIAKATNGQRLTDKTLFTAFEMLIGTPAYMSPEQADLTSMDVDTRSDIYSLGGAALRTVDQYDSI